MKYKFFINNDDVTARVLFGANVKERFAEELDVGSLTLSYFDDGDAIKVLSRVDIVEYEEDDTTIKKTYNMLVMRDYVQPITKQPPLQYKHELQLIELTHKLDYYIVNALAFTQPIEDLTVAPFEHFYETTVGSDTYDGVAPNTTIEFPELPDIFNRYSSGFVVDPIGTAKVWVPNDDGSEPTAILFEEPDLFATVYRIDERLNSENEIVEDKVLLTSVNISQNALDLTSYDNGKYSIKIGINDNFLVFGTQDTGIERYFEYFIEIDDISTYTLFDVVNKIRNVSPIEKKTLHEETRIFNISPQLEERLKKITAPQIYINKLTTREALNETLRYVNAISRIIRNEDDVLTADFFNDKSDTYTFNLGDVFSTAGAQDNINYVSNNRSFIKNAINGNELDNPSVDELGDIFKGIRSSSFQVLPENGIIELQYNIYRLLSVTAKVTYEFDYDPISALGATPSSTSRREEIEIDLTPYIVEKNLSQIARKVREVLGTAGDLDKLNRPFFRDRQIELASYSFGDNTIDIGGTVGSELPRTKWQRVIEAALAETISYREGERYKLDSGLYPTTQAFGSENVFKRNSINTNGIYSKDKTNKLNIVNNDYLLQIPVKVTYIALEDAIIDSQKEDTTIIDKYSEKVNNINARISNYERASINNYGIAQRLGVPTITYGKIVTNKDEENVGDLNQNNEVVVEKDNIFYKDYKKATYQASRDFNRLSQFVKVDRAYRPFENPLVRDVINRDDIYNEYIEYSTSDSDITPRQNDTFVSDLSMKTILNSLEMNEFKNKDYVKMVLLRTDGFLRRNPDFVDSVADEYIRKALVIPVISQGGKNTLSFKFGFKSNISAGDYIRNNLNGVDTIFDLYNELEGIASFLAGNFNDFFTNDGTYSARPYGWWREFTTYGDKNGFFNEMHFKFLTNFNLDPNYANEGYLKETQFLPLISYETSNPTAYFNDQNNVTAFESGNGIAFDDPMIIDKNTSEIYSFTYQLSFTPKSVEDNNNIVIGRSFTTKNLLATPFKNKTMKLHIHSDASKRYSKFDDEFVKDANVVVDLAPNIEILENFGRPYGIKILADLSTATQWAIADEEGNLYLANNTDNPYVFFEPRNKRSTINYNW